MHEHRESALHIGFSRHSVRSCLLLIMTCACIYIHIHKESEKQGY